MVHVNVEPSEVEPMSRLLDLIEQYNQTRPVGEPPLNKARLSEAAGISRPTLNSIEHGRIGLLRNAQSVADILGVTVQELIDDGAQAAA